MHIATYTLCAAYFCYAMSMGQALFMFGSMMVFLLCLLLSTVEGEQSDR
jgi:hypothetical protein